MPFLPGPGVIRMSGDITQAIIHEGIGYVLFQVNDGSNSTMYQVGDTVYVREPFYMDESILDVTILPNTSYLAEEENVHGELTI